MPIYFSHIHHLVQNSYNKHFTENVDLHLTDFDLKHLSHIFQNGYTTVYENFMGDQFNAFVLEILH